MSEIPIYIDGVREGTLTVESGGSSTVLDARLRDVGRVVRLTVFGEGEAYLGVPAPENGELRLVRRLTRSELRTFPARPAYCAEKRREEPPEGPLPEPQEPPRHVLWFGGRPHYF